MEARQKNGEKRRELGTKMGQKTVLLSLSLAAVLAVSGCGGKKDVSRFGNQSTVAKAETSEALNNEVVKASGETSAPGGTAATSKTSEESSKFPTEVRTAFTELRDVNYNEKKSNARKPGGEVLTPTSDPVTVGLPTKGFQRSSDPKQASYEIWVVIESG